MKMQVGILLLFFALSIQVGAENSPSESMTLDGHWIASCQNGKISEMRIQSENSYLREAFYKEIECKSLLFTIETLGLINYPTPNKESKSDFSLVDYRYQAIYLTPMTTDMALQFQESALCGIKTWEPLVAQLISGNWCRFVSGARPILIPGDGQRRFGIFKIVEPWVYFGQNNALEDSSSPMRRPKDLQKSPFGRRVQ